MSLKPSYRFFESRSCEYFPCHSNGPQSFNCLFCYCPLYLMKNCPGNFSLLPNGIKDCSLCSWPHEPANYARMVQVLTKLNKEGLNV